ncbi:MAG TPA: 2TM domain-containing protein [Phnomibacter sp.]|nr:2TM domain-containing protein [Phnomibacter sp.]
MQVPPNDPLWRMARKRAAFKRHLTIYFIINAFLWAVWWFTSGRYGYAAGHLPWPVWATLGWGLGLAFNYFDAYGPADKKSAIEQEYEKLKREQQNQAKGYS